jgi:cytochrome c
MRRVILAAAILLLCPHLAVAQDTSAGEAAFKKCTACHDVGDGARNRMGPVLNGVFGRTAGTLEGFGFSKAMVAAGDGGLIWTPETMAAFLKKPREFVKGTKMAFVGINDDTEIKNIETYLLTFSPEFTPPSRLAVANAEGRTRA